MTTQQMQTLEASLKKSFDFGSWKDDNYYWEPIVQTQNKQALAFYIQDLFTASQVEQIAQKIASIYGPEVVLLTEENGYYRVQSSTLNFNEMETAYCNPQADWLIYICHEGSVTFAGQELLAHLEPILEQFSAHKNKWE